jgi:teichuronic acid exporter
VGESKLKRKTVKGFFWSSIESFLSQGQGIIFGIILARILSPEEFGLLGMITIFISVGQVFVDCGLSQSLIRKQDCSNDDYSTVFWVNIAIGAVSYLLIWIAAPFIADFYGKPELILLTRITSLVILIGSLTLIQQTIFTKDIDFKTITKSSAIGTFISGIASLVLAFTGFGVWSLVWRIIINQVVRSLILWNQNRWRPKFFCSRQLLKEHFAFGSNILLISVMSALYKSFYNLIIGKSYSEKILGYYTNADQYSTMPSSTISSVTNKVSYPVLSEIQNDNERLKTSIRKLITMVMYISFVAMFFMAAVAKPLFIIVLGEKWLPSVVIFQVLCMAYTISPMLTINQNIMKIKGRSDLFLRTEIIKYLLLTPLIILGAIFGIKVLIAGIVFFYWIGFVINAMYSGKLIGFSFIDQSLEFLPALAIAMVSAIITWSVGVLFPWSNVVLLSVQVVLYPCLIIFFSFFFKVEAFFELRKIMADKLTVDNLIRTIKNK